MMRIVFRTIYTEDGLLQCCDNGAAVVEIQILRKVVFEEQFLHMKGGGMVWIRLKYLS